MARPTVKGAGDNMSFRFNQGIRKAATEAARKKGLTVTDMIEQMLRQEFDRMGIEITDSDE